MNPEIRRVVRYLIFGLSAAGLDFGVLNLLLAVGLDSILAKGLGYLCALFFTILLIGKYVFESSSSGHVPTLIILYMASGALNLAVFLACEAIGLPILTCFVLATGTSSATNYSALRFFNSRWGASS